MELTGFQGKIALVTGATGGIGQSVVEGLVESGCKVIATDRILAEEALSSSTFRSPQVIPLPLDVTQAPDVDALVARVEQEHGPIDFGVHVAGVLVTGLVTETSDDAWRHAFSVNVDGVFHLSRALAMVMKPRKRGSIVTVSSNAAGIPRYAMAAYAASKAASTMFTRCLGLELAEHGIRCNIVAPGSTLTPMQTGMWEDETGEQRVIDGLPEIYKTGIPLKKLATPADIANSVLFLLSDQSGHTTMADLYVDGGATLRA